MKKLLSAVFVAALALGAALGPTEAAAKEWKKVRIGVESAYPPFSQVTPEGELVGFDIDIGPPWLAALGCANTALRVLAEIIRGTTTVGRLHPGEQPVTP